MLACILRSSKNGPGQRDALRVQDRFGGEIPGPGTCWCSSATGPVLPRTVVGSAGSGRPSRPSPSPVTRGMTSTSTGSSTPSASRRQCGCRKCHPPAGPP